jgi:hypothetical protein
MKLLLQHGPEICGQLPEAVDGRPPHARVLVAAARAHVTQLNRSHTVHTNLTLPPATSTLLFLY